MNVLHFLDHSRPVQTGSSVRSHSIVRAQRARGLRPVVLTSPKHTGATAGREEHDGIRHYRTPRLPLVASALPLVRELFLQQKVIRSSRIDCIA